MDDTARKNVRGRRRYCDRVPQIVAIVCCIALLGFAGFQLVLLANIPLARFAWGGEDHYLQPRYRAPAIAVAAASVIGAFAALQGANILPVVPAIASQLACYLFAVAFFAAFVFTARSRSLLEKQVMLPFYVVMSGLFLIVAITGHLTAG